MNTTADIQLSFNRFGAYQQPRTSACSQSDISPTCVVVISDVTSNDTEPILASPGKQLSEDFPTLHTLSDMTQGSPRLPPVPFCLYSLPANPNSVLQCTPPRKRTCCKRSHS